VVVGHAGGDELVEFAAAVLAAGAAGVVLLLPLAPPLSSCDSGCSSGEGVLGRLFPRLFS
jgi:hypothetical protein